MDVPLLAVSSSPEEWEKSGRSLFQNKRYLQALHCFERAGLSREVVVSRTYYLREQARLTPAGESRKNRQTRTAAFLVAAKAFLECAKAATNATYKRVYYRNAGDCFERAEEKGQAACAYLEAQEYTTAAKLFRGCAKFDEAVDVVKRYRQEMDAEIAQNIFDVARLFYFRGGELQ
jgi:tetratricopeptide (TPR) repeat protein